MPGRIVCSVSGSIARYDATTKKTDECVTEVSVQGHMQRQPKWTHHKLGADRDLVVSTTFKKGTLPQAVNLQTLADTGSQVFFMVGYDCVPHGAVIAAPKPIGLVGQVKPFCLGEGRDSVQRSICKCSTREYSQVYIHLQFLCILPG